MNENIDKTIFSKYIKYEILFDKRMPTYNNEILDKLELKNILFQIALDNDAVESLLRNKEIKILLRS